MQRVECCLFLFVMVGQHLSGLIQLLQLSPSRTVIRVLRTMRSSPIICALCFSLVGGREQLGSCYRPPFHLWEVMRGLQTPHQGKEACMPGDPVSELSRMRILDFWCPG
jgi:hypothetical protein